MNIFTDNPDFYPTPDSVIERMMMNENIVGKRILEPSAGKGNIVDWLNNNGAHEVIACEKDPNLRQLLSCKCAIISDDFMSVTSEMVSHIDYIVMNPPFSKGAEHILHAFEIAPNGCTIIALCNNSTVHNGFTKNEKLSEIIDLYGRDEYLGDVFSKDAERTTYCPVTLVKIYKTGTGSEEWSGYYFSEFDEDIANTNKGEGIMPYNIVRDMVNRYVAACKLFEDTLEATRRINEIAAVADMFKDCTGNPVEYLPIKFEVVTNGKFSGQVTYERYKKELQKYYWKILFNQLNMDKYATKLLREQINKFVECQSHVPFTMGNIYRVFDIIYQTNGQRMQSAIVEAFDTICSYSAENSTAGEKWKTNSDYMINRKFIVPYLTRWDSRWPSDHVDISYSSNSNSIQDVTRALCYITGENFDNIPNLHNISRWHIPYGEWFTWGFFRCKAFKKGTMHFEFLDEDVWHKFNTEVAKIRGWALPKKTQKSKKRA